MSETELADAYGSYMRSRMQPFTGFRPPGLSHAGVELSGPLAALILPEDSENGIG
jgi:hypothetical protein